MDDLSFLSFIKSEIKKGRKTKEKGMKMGRKPIGFLPFMY